MSRERTCSVRGCGQTPYRSGYLFCRDHWVALPDDIRARIVWAVREGETDDLFAAINAALTDLTT